MSSLAKAMSVVKSFQKTRDHIFVKNEDGKKAMHLFNFLCPAGRFNSAGIEATGNGKEVRKRTFDKQGSREREILRVLSITAEKREREMGI